MPNKLLDFQKKVGVILKDSINPLFKSNYTDINALLDTIKPILNELELVLIQPLKVIDGKNILTTKLIDNNNVIAESEIILPDLQDPQKIGSAITYYRRYSIQSLMLLQAVDDDANKASNQTPIRRL
jgi:hypothetical protein